MADGAVVYQNTKEISPYEIPEQQAGTSRNIGFATINEVQTSRQHDSTIGQPETLQTTSVNRSTANNTKPNLKRFYNVFIAVGVLAVVLAIVLCTILVTKNEIMNISLQLQDQINSNKALIVAQTTDLGNKTEFLLTENENTKEFSLQLEEKVNNNKGLIVNQTADLGNKTEFLLTENENTKEFTLELEEKVNNNKGLIVNQTADLACPVISFNFPRASTTDYVRYRGYFPKLKKLHMCAWVRHDAVGSGNERPVASYAVSEQHNEMWWNEWLSENRIHVDVGGSRVYIANTSPHNNQTFVCISYNGERDVVMTRDLTTSVRGQLSSSQSVRGGGVLILGQDQDSLAGGFDTNQAFRGTISNFMLWPRVLTDDEVRDIAHRCRCPSDYVIAMTMDRVELNGDVTYDASQACPTL